MVLQQLCQLPLADVHKQRLPTSVQHHGAEAEHQVQQQGMQHEHGPNIVKHLSLFKRDCSTKGVLVHHEVRGGDNWLLKHSQTHKRGARWELLCFPMHEVKSSQFAPCSRKQMAFCKKPCSGLPETSGLTSSIITLICKYLSTLTFIWRANSRLSLELWQRFSDQVFDRFH